MPGLFHLRNLLVEILILETDAPDRGGALHLNRLITAEQQALLHALPAPIPEPEALTAAHMAYAAAFLPRARALAAAQDVPWPDAFEAATWAHLNRALGLTPPPNP